MRLGSPHAPEVFAEPETRHGSPWFGLYLLAEAWECSDKRHRRVQLERESVQARRPITFSHYCDVTVEVKAAFNNRCLSRTVFCSAEEHRTRCGAVLWAEIALRF